MSTLYAPLLRRPLPRGAAFALAAGLFALGACRSAVGPDGPPPDALSAAAADSPAATADRAMPSLDLWELARVEELYRTAGQELVGRYRAGAKERSASGDHAAALPLLDRAIAIATERRELHLQRAETLVALGDQLRAEGQAGLYIQGAYEDARRAFTGAPRTPRARLGAAHVEWLLGDGAEALRLAQDAVSRLAQIEAEGQSTEDAQAEQIRSPLGTAEEILGRAASLAFAQAVLRGDGGAELDDLRDRAGAALDRWIAAAPGDAAAWNQAVDFELWRRDPEAALQTALAGLDQVVDHSVLEARLYDLAVGARGVPGAADLLLAREERGELSANLRWAIARAQFEAALANLPTPTDTPASYPDQRRRFADAEARFGRLGEELPADDPRRAEALGWQVVARTGRGWVQYAELDWNGAAATFFSTNELVPRGVEWRIDGRLRSALIGLQLVAEKLLSEDDVAAAELLWRTHLLAPSDALLASNAGLFLRDAGARQETLGRLLCALVHDQFPDDQRPLLGDLRALANLAADGSEDRSDKARAAANRWIAAGVEATERCYQAYRAALAASPEDPWILRDTALVPIYSLHRDLEQAVAWLERAIELARPAAEAAAAGTQGRGSITEVWGDAHENLGVYHLNFTGDLEQAVAHFRRAVEIGPMPEIERPWVRDLIRDFEAGDLDAVRRARDVRSFGKPCP